MKPRAAWLGILMAADLAGSAAFGAVVRSPSIAAVMRPGMTIEGMMMPLDPFSGPGGGVIRADKATVSDKPGVLLLHGLHVTRRGAFELAAPLATYDSVTRCIRAPSGFTALGGAMRISGEALQSPADGSRLDLTGNLEIRMGPGAAQPALLASEPPFLQDPWILPARTGAPRLLEARSTALISRFTGRLDRFESCLTVSEGAPGSRMLLLAGRSGGVIDPRNRALDIKGPAAFIASGLVLICQGGIGVSQAEDGEGFRTHGSGPVEGWLHQGMPPRETWIRCDAVEGAGGGEVVQFQGGPVVVRRDGLELTATESWQFLRIFADGRVVLSPGAWNMAGGRSSFR